MNVDILRSGLIGEVPHGFLGRRGGVSTGICAGLNVGWGSADEQPIGRMTAEEMRRIQHEHDFASGSMGPKVEAALRFVESGGTRSVITSLENIEQAVHGRAGTVIEAERS